MIHYTNMMDYIFPLLKNSLNKTNLSLEREFRRYPNVNIICLQYFGSAWSPNSGVIRVGESISRRAKGPYSVSR